MSKVLVAEDEPALLDSYTEIVRALGHECVSALDGSHALELARQHQPDLVVTDYMMPGKTGIQLLRALRVDPALDYVPVILLSAARPPEADRRDAWLFLTKPVAVERLESAITEGLAVSARAKRPVGTAAARAVPGPDTNHLSLAREDMLSWVSHEIESPLAAAMTATELGIRDARAIGIGSLEKRLLTVTRQLKRMDELVTSLLDAAQLQDGRLGLDGSPSTSPPQSKRPSASGATFIPTSRSRSASRLGRRFRPIPNASGRSSTTCSRTRSSTDGPQTMSSSRSSSTTASGRACASSIAVAAFRETSSRTSSIAFTASPDTADAGTASASTSRRRSRASTAASSKWSRRSATARPSRSCFRSRRDRSVASTRDERRSTDPVQSPTIVDVATITAFGLEIPGQALSLAGFREWVASLGESAPRMCFSSGRLHIEMSPQDYKTHAPVVDAINDTLVGITRERDLGRYFRPPSWFTDEAASLSTEPDGFFVRWGAIESGRVRVNPERTSELLGRPDMVLEVVSKSSRKKDTTELVEDYARAGIEEYWIADATSAQPELRILVLRSSKYEPSPPDPDGWIASPMWGAAFRLVRRAERAGWIDYSLERR